jgi:hypothetical protein
MLPRGTDGRLLLAAVAAGGIDVVANIWLWHKDREVVTYSYGLPWARVIAVP